LVRLARLAAQVADFAGYAVVYVATARPHARLVRHRGAPRGAAAAAEKNWRDMIGTKWHNARGRAPGYRLSPQTTTPSQQV
jgi:hypothetical protein